MRFWLKRESSSEKIFVSGGSWTARFGALCFFLTQFASAQTAIATVAAGTNPDAVAVNPVTNKIYVANYADGTVTVINGATNTTSTVVTGTNAACVVVNPVTKQDLCGQQRRQHGNDH